MLDNSGYVVQYPRRPSGAGIRRWYSLCVIATSRQLVLAVMSVGCIIASSIDSPQWLSPIPAEHREQLAKRLDAYVKANRSKDWTKLFDLVSDSGRGGTNRDVFVAKMKAAHQKDFSNSPDLLDFRPARTENADSAEVDIYGCGKARRESQSFNGIALVHAVFQHNDWFFSGWTFTEFPNEPCKNLADPSWEAPGPMEWGRPMQELRDLAGMPIHIDGSKR